MLIACIIYNKLSPISTLGRKFSFWHVFIWLEFGVLFSSFGGFVVLGFCFLKKNLELGGCMEG